MSSVTQKQSFKRQTSTSQIHAREVQENKGSNMFHKLHAFPSSESSVSAMALRRTLENKKSSSCGNAAARAQSPAVSKSHCSPIQSCSGGNSPLQSEFEKIVKEFNNDWEDTTSSIKNDEKETCKNLNKCKKSTRIVVSRQSSPRSKKNPAGQLNFLDDFWSDDDEDILTSGIFELKNPLSFPNPTINNGFIIDLVVKKERKTTPHKFEIIVDATGFK